MQNMESIWYGSIMDFPRDSMRPHHYSARLTSPDYAVTVRKRPATPVPANIRATIFDKFPESLLKGYDARSHIAFLPRLVSGLALAWNDAGPRYLYPAMAGETI